MSLPVPDEVWFDAAALVSLAHAPNGLAALQQRALGDRARWVDAVEQEVTRQRRPHEHIPGLHAVTANTAWLGEYELLDGEQQAEAYELRDDITIDDDHADKSLGEAQTVVIARDRFDRSAASGAQLVVVAASDDGDLAVVARNAGAAGKIQVWSSAHILSLLVHLGSLTCDRAYDDYLAMVSQRRGLHRSLTRDQLCSGTIPNVRPRR